MCAFWTLFLILVGIPGYGSWHSKEFEIEIEIYTLSYAADRFSGLVVRVSGYRYRGAGPIPAATRFFEKYWVWNGVHSA
jgi:hypothetical protein